MKIDLEKSKINKNLVKLIQHLPALGVIAFGIIFMLLCYFALVPREDPATKEIGQKKIDELNIHFNTSLLYDLSKTHSSTGPINGRNPFIN